MRTLSPLSINVLIALADGPSHGYGLMRRLRGHGFRAGAGTIYGALSRMQEAGWIEEGAAERARGPRGQRQLFAITPSGLRALKEAARQVHTTADLIRAHPLIAGPNG
jgi:DNA-binding PadR family transcriptional regulator